MSAQADRRASVQAQYRQQKSALTRAVKSGDVDKIRATVRAAVVAWDTWQAWPDDWSRWERALNDVLPWHASVDIRDFLP